MSQSAQEVLSPEQKFQRQLFTVRIALTQGTQAASLRSGIPERTVRRWKARFTQQGLAGLRDRSRRPRYSPGKKDVGGALAQALILLFDREPGLTQLQLFVALLGTQSEDSPSMSWLKRAKRRMGLTRKRRVKTHEHKKRYEIPVPGYLQIDTKIVDREGDGDGEKLIQFTAIDECSRVRYLEGSLTKGAAAATAFLRRCVEFYSSLGVQVRRAQTDHGTEFTLPGNPITLASYARGETDEARFTTECERLGIDHRLIRVRTPQLNGKVERSHRTDGERFYSRFKFRDAPSLDHALQHVWMPEYNERRPHSALGGRTPMDFLRLRLEEIQTGKFQEYLPATDQETAA